MSGTEILRTIYNPDLFPITFLEDQSMLTETNLCISEKDIIYFREKCQKIEVDIPKFNKTLEKVLNGPDELLKARAIALVFMMKNVINVSKFFAVILENFRFNRMFFEELKNHKLLMLDVVEEIRDLLKTKSFRTDDILPIINEIVLANEDSPNPLSVMQLKMIEPKEINDELRHKINSKYPIILPFDIKYQQYLKGELPTSNAVFSVNRYQILQTIWTMDTLSDKNVKFSVVFTDEDDVDDNGDLTKEFIDIAFHKIVEPETDLFVLHNGFYWFKYHQHMTNELLKHYQCVGTLLALALLNKLTIPIHFPRFLYKRLLYKQTTLADLALFNPLLYASVKAIENNTVTGKIPIDFIYIDPVENYLIDLTDFKNVTNDKHFDPEKVTNENKGEFIDHLLIWVFEKSCQQAFNAFEEGFNRVTKSEMLFKNFSLEELDEIVSGEIVFNWEDLKKSAKYVKPYHSETHVVGWFWRYFDQIDENSKFSVLKFITGSTSVPKGGIKDIHITFKQSDDDIPLTRHDDDSIYLPQFKSYDELVEKFNEQINVN